MEDNNQLLVKVQKLIIQLQSADPDQRLEACEELHRLPSLPDHALEALLVATHDPDRGVADAAQWALSIHPVGTSFPAAATPDDGNISPSGDQP